MLVERQPGEAGEKRTAERERRRAEGQHRKGGLAAVGGDLADLAGERQAHVLVVVVVDRDAFGRLEQRRVELGDRLDLGERAGRRGKQQRRDRGDDSSDHDLSFSFVELVASAFRFAKAPADPP